MKSLFLLPVAAAISAPVSAQSSTDYDAAVAARQTGDARQAVILLDRWLIEHPDDSDALVQRGFAHLALGHRAEAAADFRYALELAPDYTDAKEGLARAESVEIEPQGAYAIAGGAWSDLDRGAADWSEAAIDFAASVTNEAAVGGRVAWFRRFGVEDTEFIGRVTLHSGDNLWLRASAGGTPNAQFRPEIAFAAGGDYRLKDGPAATVLTLDASYQRFPLQEVVAINPGVVQYFADGRAWATLRGIGTVADGGNLEVGALARIDYAPEPRRRFFAGLANGPDTDLRVVTRVTSVFGGAELPVSESLSVLPSLAHEWRENGGERTEFRLDLKVAF